MIALLAPALSRAAPSSGGGGGASASTVTGISFAIGTTDGGSTVTITGTGFANLTAANVTIGGTAVASITSYNSTTIVAVTAAHAAGVCDVVVVNQTLTNGFEYLPAYDTLYASYSDSNALTGFSTDITPGAGTVTASTARPQPGKTYSVECDCTSVGGTVVRLSKSFANNPALNQANGIYLAYRQNISSAHLAELDGVGGQMKTHLFRGNNGDGPAGYLMTGMGTGFGSQLLQARIDVGVATINGGANIGTWGDGIWLHHLFWMGRNGANGRARGWINGVSKFDVTSSDLGTTSANETYMLFLGAAYVVADAAVKTYFDDIRACNGCPV